MPFSASCERPMPPCVCVYENSKLVTNFNPARRDENIEYYLDKLRSLYKKFAPEGRLSCMQPCQQKLEPDAV